MSVKVGDTVLFKKYGPDEIEVESKKYLVTQKTGTSRQRGHARYNPVGWQAAMDRPVVAGGESVFWQQADVQFVARVGR